jgi:hypothetical protein
VLCNRYDFTIATRSLGEFGGANEAPASAAMLAEGATREFAQGTAARRVELKMDRRRRCFSVAGRKGICSLVAPWRRAILNSTIVKAYRLHNTGSPAAAVVGISSNVRLVKLILIPIFANNLDRRRPPRWDAFRCARRISSK